MTPSTAGTEGRAHFVVAWVANATLNARPEHDSRITNIHSLAAIPAMTAWNSPKSTSASAPGACACGTMTSVLSRPRRAGGGHRSWSSAASRAPRRGWAPVRAEQFRALGLGPIQQPVRQLIADQRPATRLVGIAFTGTLAVPVIARPSASRNSCGPPSGHITYTAGKTRAGEHRFFVQFHFSPGKVHLQVRPA